MRGPFAVETFPRHLRAGRCAGNRHCGRGRADACSCRGAGGDPARRRSRPARRDAAARRDADGRYRPSAGAARCRHRPATTGTANYGKPKPPADPTKRYKGQPKTFANPLPALVPYPTSAAARKSGATSDPQDIPAATVATVPPIPKKPKPKVEADPFAPVGIGIGSLRLVPYVETDAGYDSNPNQQTGAVRGSPTLRGETGFTLQSDWSVHQLKGELHAGYTDDLEVPQASSPDGNGKFDLRLDATRDTAIDLEARGTLATQPAGSPILGTRA